MTKQEKEMILEWITDNTNPNTLVMSKNKMKAYINSLPTDDTPTLNQINNYFEKTKEDNLDMPCHANCKIQPCLNCNEWANHIEDISEVINERH